MFERVEAVRFDRMMSSGKTKPMLLACDDGSDGTIEVVAKFSQGCSYGGLIREAMTAMLALDLGLPVPPPFLVELSPEFIDSVPNASTAEFLRNGDRFGFGSKRLPDSFGQWVNGGGRLTTEIEHEALEILALDCWLTNPDRRVTNPNLLTDGRQFAIFDHEHALMTTLILFWKEPWLVNALDDASPPKEHVFFESLRSKKAYALEDLIVRLESVSDQRINDYAAALPPSWASADNWAVTSARKFITDLRNNLASAGAELKRALS